MNRYTFKDVVGSKRNSLAEDLDHDDEDDEGDTAIPTRGDNAIEGEEDEGQDRFNEAGEVLEPFNMKNERDEGGIDASGNFTYFKKDQKETDAWLEGMDEAAMEKGIGEAAAALKKRENLRKQREEDDARKERKGVVALKDELLLLLQPSETVAQAIRRYGGQNSARIGAPKSGLKKVLVSKEARSVIERITEIADQLLAQDSTLSGVYDMTYEALEASTVLWEYMGHDGAIQGPFTSIQISDWKKQGFFTGSTAVMMRRVERKRSLDSGSEESRSTKKSKIEEPKKEAHEELLDDFEDGDSDDGLTIPQIIEKDRLKKEAAQKAAAATSLLLPPAGTGIETKSEEWILSDNIDFGDYSELPSDSDDEDDENNN